MQQLVRPMTGIMAMRMMTKFVGSIVGGMAFQKEPRPKESLRSQVRSGYGEARELTLTPEASRHVYAALSLARREEALSVSARRTLDSIFMEVLEATGDRDVGKFRLVLDISGLRVGGR